MKIDQPTTEGGASDPPVCAECDKPIDSDPRTCSACGQVMHAACHVEHRAAKCPANRRG
jgi:predicted amidophosphoribosyltransferase